MKPSPHISLFEITKLIIRNENGATGYICEVPMVCSFRDCGKTIQIFQNVRLVKAKEKKKESWKAHDFGRVKNA